MLDKEARGIVAEGKPQELRDHSDNPWVRSFFTRQIPAETDKVEPINKAFFMMAREQKFDVSEMAIVTYLQAKAYNKPLVLMPATMMGRFQHGTMLYNSERGTLRPQDLPGKRVGVRAFSQTTGAWIRGILWKDYGLDLGAVKWVTFEDAHVAEYRDPLGSISLGGFE